MNAEHIEQWSVGRAAAAVIVGIDEMTLGNWIARYDPLPHRRSGRGTSLYFTLSDLMLLAGIKALIGAGLKPEQAADAMSIYGGIYGTLLHNGRQNSRYPGVMVLTRNHEGRWVGADSHRDSICIQIRSWPIFDDIWPRLKEEILKNHGKAEYQVVARAVEEFAARIEDIREQRWR